jgi:hypothetical protein
VVFNKDLAVSAGGTTQATALQLSKYYNVVTTAVPAASTGLKLPNVATLSLHSGNAKGVVAIVNATSDTLRVFPASAGQFLDSSSVNPVTIAGFGRKNFITTSSVAWASVSAYE